MMVKKLILSTMLLASVSFPVLAAPSTFSVEKDYHTINEASFISTAPMVTVKGVTNQVSGTAKVDLAKLTSSSGEIKIDLASLDTGIAKRNDHMRSVLNTDKNQYAIFNLKKLKTNIDTLPAYKAVLINAEGELTINGITKKQDAVLEVMYMPEQDKNYRAGDWIQLKTDFEIKLSEFGINPPGLVPMKLNNAVKINVNVMGKKN